MSTRTGTFRLEFTESAVDDLRFLEKHEQRYVLDIVELQLTAAPLTPTRNRKELRANPLSEWEIRAGDFRIFYDVDVDERLVTVKAIGWKEHNRLLIRGREFLL